MVRYSDELIEEIRNSNDIVEVVSQYVTLKRSGRNFLGLCPFHKEKSPSFSVSPDKQIFHCFGCGAGGNVIHFMSKIENINFIESLEILADKAGIRLPDTQNAGSDKMQILKDKVYKVNEKAAMFCHENLYSPLAKSAQEYVKKRKLTNSTLKSFMIGYSGTFNELYQYLKKEGFQEEEILASHLVSKTENGKYIDRFRNRLIFPIFDIRGRVIAFGGRVLDDSKPKYINSADTIVYNKGRHLYALNLAKNSGKKEIIVVEGYMDTISLYQREITNVVASLGTAMTETQGRLLTKYSEKVIIGYDSDGAGQAATLRGLEIIDQLGCDVRVLQLEDAKDPDEFVVKYGNGRFHLLVEKAISLIEFKVKILKKNLNLDNTKDKIKFLNEIAKLLSKVENKIEKEIYIDKISKEYEISKEAIYAQTNKLDYASNQGKKELENNRLIHKKQKEEHTQSVTKEIIQRENTLLYLLINYNEAYEKFKEMITVEDFKFKENKIILQKLYDEYKKGNSNIQEVISSFEEQEMMNHITAVLMTDYAITDVNKAIEDLLNTYKKEKLIIEKGNILEKLDDKNLKAEEIKKLEERLTEIILALAKMK